MKSMYKYFFIIAILLIAFNLRAQDSTKIDVSAGADIVSRYVWRGIDFGNAPAIQPTVEAKYKNLTIGAWGSQSISSNTGGLETDIYLGYDFDFGLSLGISDYYFPGEKLMITRDLPDTSQLIIEPQRTGNYFDFENLHFLEANVNYEIGSLKFSANYMLYNAADDLYAEIGYKYKNFEFFAGAGNEMYIADGNFNICNIGITAEKDIKISQYYSLPVSGSFIINPSFEQVHMVFCISL